MSKTNCCNCGAPLDILKSKCEFCGTKNINLTEIDLASGEAANFIFKLPNNFKDLKGAEIYLSMLAVPEIQTIEIRNESTDVYDGFHTKIASIINNSTIGLGLNLRTIPKPQHNSLCNLTIK